MSTMRRAAKMCEDCPFRLKISKAERIELARIEPEGFPCHTIAGYNYATSDIQCRGHWQVRRKFGHAAHGESVSKEDAK